MQIKITHQNADHMFVAATDLNERAGMMSYLVIDDHTISVNHTVVSKEYEGQGIAKKLLEACTEYAANNNIKILSTCAFVTAQFEKNPEKYKSIIG